MDEYNAGYVAGIEEILHLIEVAKYKPWTLWIWPKRETLAKATR